jgi:hypothetical protein
MGAILAGNAPEERLDKLNQFWAESMVHTSGSLSITKRVGRSTTASMRL